MTDLSGTITDGSSDLNYNNDMRCYYLIRPTVSVASIVFSYSTFNTESGYDFVRQRCSRKAPAS